MRNPRYDSTATAIVTGIIDLFRKKESVEPVSSDERLDGLVCLVTGSNSGLGRATAIEAAKRGATVIMACRSGIPDAGEEVRRKSGNGNVSMVRLDLGDFDSIHRCCDELQESGIHIDRAVMNAGVVRAKAYKTEQGFEQMFGINYLGNFVFVTELLKRGIIPNSTWAENGEQNKTPRIVFVSSETHRSAPPINIESLGSFVEYTMKESVRRYGYTKLLLTTFAWELMRRFSSDAASSTSPSDASPHAGELATGDDTVDVAVHALCPGAVNTNIARDIPKFLHPIIKLFFLIFFKSPKKASRPVLYLACSRAIEGKSGIYLHMMSPKEPSPQAGDPEIGKKLWRKTEALIKTAR